ncbi:MAG: phage major capsid protein [Cytophagia bacterium]|nr:phage major capsid protein [Cytophagia bacterium]
MGDVVFKAGSLKIGDGIKLFTEHDMTRPIGKLKSFEETNNGIIGTFKIARTNAGDDALAEAQEGLRTGLSIGATIDDYVTQNENVIVNAATLKEVSHVTFPAFGENAQITEVAASADTSQPQESEETLSNEVTPEIKEEVAVEATPAVEAAERNVRPAIFTAPRSPINSKASYLEHSIKAKLGSQDSAQWVMHADAQASNLMTAADDSFTTNPAFKPVQYVSTVVDTLIGSRPAIDAIGSRALPAAGMTISVPKITTAGTVAETAEGGNPSETGIVSAYVNLDVKKYAGLQRYSVELLERSDPSFFQAMLDNMQRAYNKATDAAVVAALTAGGTQAATTAATSAGIISFVSTETAAAYSATGEIASAYLAGTSQWSLLMGATDTTGRPIYNAIAPSNAAGQASPRSLRGNVLGLDLYVDSNMVSTTIDESAFIVVPSSVAIYESPVLRLSTNVPTTGEIETSLYGYLACGVLVAGGVRRFNLT